ncbi:sodium-coupled neutral amino acid transporter 7 [Anabrus simplex]|uniref:sodium-coupled neutral amino acid transporter 7 n=1 Tax=Anabrus simplex TaxID=316456 RepID=UPI0035A37A6D
MCGRAGLVACSITVALYCFGTCITFLIIIGDQFDRVLASVHGPDFCHYWYMNRMFTIAASSTVVILPLCYSRRIDFLKYVSSLGVVAVVYVVALIIYQKFAGNFVPGTIKTAPDSWTDVFLVVPVICFGYQCHVSVIPIYACMKERTLHNFTWCVSCAIAFCVVIYSLAGTFGYLTFGSNVTSDILESYSGSNPLVLISIVAIAIKTFTTYPILLFCGREAVSVLWTNLFHRNQSDVAVTEKRRRIIIATLWFLLSLVLAIVSPDIGVVIDILGSLAAIFIFVFPGICLLQSTLHKDPYLLLNKDRFAIFASFLFILVGTFIFGVVLVQGSERFSRKSHSMNQICI